MSHSKVVDFLLTDMENVLISPLRWVVTDIPPQMALPAFRINTTCNAAMVSLTLILANQLGVLSV